ncbi:MAG: flagellar hook-associated protein FlgL [Gammaproteobacteria bacterium]|nr:flagellar hook-associated protein FlgL [Gammaproteobacteria bacterium]
MRIASEQLFQRSLSLMLQQQADVVRTQNQISSGKRILSPADAPADAARVLDISQTLAATDQYQTNAGIATVRLEQADSVLTSVQNALQRVRDLALQGRSAQNSAADRTFIAAEVRERLDELVGLANTRDANGEYVFAGFSSDAVPFTRDIAGNVTYAGDAGRRELQIGAERRIADREPGDAVFMAIRNGNGKFVTDPAPTNTGTGVIAPGSVTDPATYQAHDFRIVFSAAGTFDVIDDTTATTVLAAQSYVAGASINFNGLAVEIKGTPAAGDTFRVGPSRNQSVFTTMQKLVTALETPFTSPAVEARFAHELNRTLTDIDQALEHVLSDRTSIGARLKAIDAQKVVNDDLSYQLTSVRSSLEDVDIVEASISLNRGILALQAAQQAFARTQQLSLFNYL